MKKPLSYNFDREKDSSRRKKHVYNDHSLDIYWKNLATTYQTIETTQLLLSNRIGE